MKKKIDTKNLVFLDIETTGLNPIFHEIIEICLITDTQVYLTKIKPQRIKDADPQSLKINNYNHKEWFDAPLFKDVLPKIQELTAGKMLAGHHVSFDYSFLTEQLSRSGAPALFDRRRIDTINLAFEHLRPLGLNSLSLDSIRTFLGWSKEGAHTALKDCKDAKRLFEYLSQFGPLDRAKLRLKRAFNGYLIEGGK